MSSKKVWVLIAAIVAVGSGVAVVVHRQHSGGVHHEHGGAPDKSGAGAHHDHGGAPGQSAIAQLKLNAGAKWQTDAALREGMTAIRSDVVAAIDPIHAGRYTPDEYAALAKKVEGNVQTVIAKCKLPPDADAQLHLVVADLFAGASTLKQEGDRTAGAVKLIAALNAYGEYFDHPQWQAIKH